MVSRLSPRPLNSGVRCPYATSNSNLINAKEASANMRVVILSLAVISMLAWSSGVYKPTLSMGRVIRNLEASAAEQFADGALSLESSHNALTDFAPDGRTIYLTRTNEKFTSSTVLISRFVRGRWTNPEVAPFSDNTSDSGASLTPDGSQLFFTSKRPVGKDNISDEWNLWVVERTRNGWQKPVPLGRPINTESSECCATVKARGAIYFSSNREGSWDIYRAEVSSRRVQKVEKLEGGINTKYGEWPSYIDPQERFLLFSSIRPDSHGGDDIYISYKEGNAWSVGKNLGPQVNTKGYEDSAILSPDRKHLIFSSRRGSGLSRIYRIRIEQTEADLRIKK